MKKIKNIIMLMLVVQVIMSSLQPVFAEGEALATPSGIKIENLENEVDIFMQKHIGESSPGASVAVIKNGEIVLSKGYGYADIEKKELVTKDSVFEYGSISKLFVWTSVMQLVEQGKLDLDSDIKEYLPEDFYKKLNIKYPITMRNIMNHSSGFGEYPFDLISLSDSKEELSLEDAILSNHPKQFYEPGTASVYSNYANALAAFIVENISGEEFYKYKQKHIFEILNMKNVAGYRNWKDNPSILDKKVVGYSKDNKKQFVDSGWSYVSLYPAGSVSGTAENLALFAMQLMPSEGEKTLLFDNNDILSTMLSSSHDIEATGTAHGFLEYNFTGDKALGHGGNTASFSSQFAFVPKDSFGFIVLTNASGELDITMGLQELLLGENKIKTTDIMDKNLIDAHSLEGNYVSMRRPEGTPSEFLSYLSLVQVKAIDKNKIDLTMMGLSASYTQTEPYQFSLIETSHPLFKVLIPHLTFRVNDKGITENILIGNGFDLSGLPKNRTIFDLGSYLATLIISLIFLIVSGIAILVYFIKIKRDPNVAVKNIFTPRILLTFAGLVLISNNLILMVNLVLKPFISYQSIKPVLMLNYIIAGAVIGFTILGIAKFKKELIKSEKIWFGLTVIIVISLMNLFINWNLFTIY